VHKPDIANKLQTIIPYHWRIQCLKPREIYIARKYFNMWRRNMALKNRDYVVKQARRNRYALVEVANSEYSGRSASFRNGRFLASQISISSDKSSESSESIKSFEINEIINSDNYNNTENYNNSENNTML